VRESLTCEQAAQRGHAPPELAHPGRVRDRWQATASNDRRAPRFPDDRIADGALVKVLEAHIEVLRTQLTVAETQIKKQAAEFAARDEKARLDYAALGEKLRAAEKHTSGRGRGLWWSLRRRQSKSLAS
jgi:hypothetical protein